MTQQIYVCTSCLLQGLSQHLIAQIPQDLPHIPHQDRRNSHISHQDHSHSSRSQTDPPTDRQHLHQDLRHSRARTGQQMMKRMTTISMTHRQMHTQRLRATSLILRAIHLAAGVTLMMANEVLKRKPIGLVLVRIIGALIKDVPTIIKRSSWQPSNPGEPVRFTPAVGLTLPFFPACMCVFDNQPASQRDSSEDAGFLTNTDTKRRHAPRLQCVSPPFDHEGMVIFVFCGHLLRILSQASILGLARLSLGASPHISGNLPQ